jgi:hypothetical protein
MPDSRVPQHVSIWPLTRLETAMFLVAVTLWAAAGVMWASGFSASSISMQLDLLFKG